MIGLTLWRRQGALTCWGARRMLGEQRLGLGGNCLGPDDPLIHD